MRAPALSSGISLLLLSVAGQAAQPQQAAPDPAARKGFPAEVALVDEGKLGSVFRQFPTGLRLYYSDLDRADRSMCNGGCATRWPPLLAPKDAKPIAEWTLVTRDNGESQWAYRGRPLYVRYHDSPEEPAGDGDEGGKWHLLPHMGRTAGPAPAAPSQK